MVSKARESAYFSNTIRRLGNGLKIRNITIYEGESTGSTLFAIWLHHSVVKPHYSNFRIITAISWVSKNLGVLPYFKSQYVNELLKEELNPGIRTITPLFALLKKEQIILQSEALLRIDDFCKDWRHLIQKCVKFKSIKIIKCWFSSLHCTVWWKQTYSILENQKFH